MDEEEIKALLEELIAEGDVARGTEPGTYYLTEKGKEHVEGLLRGAGLDPDTLFAKQGALP